MHITGKLLVWMLLLLWGLALYLSVGVVRIRGAWFTKIQKAEAESEKLVKEIAELRKTRAAREAELSRELAPWGAYWNGVKADGLNPQNGQFQLDTKDSTGAQLKLAENQIVHAFAPGADGKSSVYMGSFKFQGSRLVPTFSLRLADPLARPAAPNLPELAAGLNLIMSKVPNRAATFDSLAGWNVPAVRIRSDVPSAYVGTILELEMELVRQDTKLISEAVAYNTQLALEVAARQLVQNQTQSIAGPLPNRAVSPEFKLGYLKAIEEEVAGRDRALFAVDTLRHQLKSTTDEFSQLRQQIQQLEKALPRALPASNTTARR